jgi:hypothetical protein
MNLFRSRSIRSRGKSFSPRLESLEDRNLLSCFVAWSTPTLTVLGDNGSNQVAITDNGTAGPGSIKVQCDGNTQVIPVPITAIRVSTQGGNDAVQYTLTSGLLPGVSRSVSVDLGAGSNTFHSYFGGDLGAKSNLQLNIYGGADNDFLLATALKGFRINPGAMLYVHMDGGAGSDYIRMDYDTKLDGVFGLDLNGGAGNDTVAANITIDPGSTGLLSSLTHPATVSGGADNDDVTFNVMNNGMATVQGLLDGGLGMDIGHHTPNIPMINVP